jgi:hypothetical protein
MEQGRTAPELRTMMRIAKALGVAVDGLAASPRENPARSPEAVIRAIDSDLRLLPIGLLEHVAAIVSTLAHSTRLRKK